MKTVKHPASCVQRALVYASAAVVFGVLLALILMTCLKNGLMIAYNDSFILNLSIGVLLIAVVLLPNIAGKIKQRRQLIHQRVSTAR